MGKHEAIIGISGEKEQMVLIEEEQTALRWARYCNSRHVGFLGPTVRKNGPIEAYERLVNMCLLRCVEKSSEIDGEGYWLTVKGRNLTLRQAAINIGP